MRILVLYQNYLARGAAGLARYNEFARCWADAGHQVTVITSMVDYATGVKDTRYRRKWVVQEVDGTGITVIRTFMAGNYHKSFTNRLLSYLSFAISALWAGLLFSGKQDLVIAYSPPLPLGLSGWLVARVKRIPFVFEVGDLWPDFAIEMKVLTNRTLIALAYWLERFLYRRADRITVVTEGFSEKLITKDSKLAEKIEVIPNAADTEVFSPGPKDNWVRQKYGWGNKFVLLYAGTHGISHNLDRLLDLAQLLRNEHPEIRIVLMGDGMAKPSLVERARREYLDNVQFMDIQSRETTKDYLNAADVCVAILQKLDSFKIVHPGKLFDYMACGRPIVVAIDGLARKLVMEAGAGIYADPENIEGLKAAALKFYSDPDSCARCGSSGYRYITTHYTRQALSDSFLQILSAVIREHHQM